MKCWKCHTTMIKDEYSRTATCPCCGRTVNYHTRSEKRAVSSFGGGSGGDYSGDGCSGCAKVLGIGALITNNHRIATSSVKLNIRGGFLVFSRWRNQLYLWPFVDCDQIHF